jgi:hypothetical protein
MPNQRQRAAILATIAVMAVGALAAGNPVRVTAASNRTTESGGGAPKSALATACAGADTIYCDGFDLPPTTMPGTVPAQLGPPSTVAFNGLGLIADTLHHAPRHAVPTDWGSFPAPLVNPAMPSIPNITLLNRRDALIVYVPAVQGAADYRAYIYNAANVSFSGTKPRGAVIACAGFRQRYVRNIDALQSGSPLVSAVSHRELIQAIEVPGLVADGNYTVIVEALASPCPFPGVMAHTNATIPLSTVPLSSSGTDHFSLRSFSDVKTLYGNEILNGQGSTLGDYMQVNAGHDTPAELIGQPVPPNDAQIPADPTVIARSAISVTRPALDEAINAPIFDVGPNSHWDDFSSDAIMTTLHTETRSEGAGLVSGGQFGDWYFWGIAVQPALNAQGNWENGNNPKGMQVWRRHGRLYTTFGDWAQDVLGGVYFASTRTQPEQLDTTKYVHSFFRVDSGATPRRYWHWMICGGATASELADPSTGVPRGRPVAQPFFYSPQGRNPSAPMLGETLNAYHDKECLSLIQLGGYWNWGPPSNATNTWMDEPHSQLHAFINPQVVENGVISLKPDGMDDFDTPATGGIFWRLDANRHPTGPMFEPFDQQAPLTHYDIFVRPDRVIMFINGRQAWCGDLSDRPLTMQYGKIAYGSVLYHSSAETSAAYVGVESYQGAVGGSFHYIMNTPWADTRVWDAAGESEKIDIPSQFVFDAGACFKPKSTAVQ